MSFDFVKTFKEIDVDHFMTMIINHRHETQPKKICGLFKELDYATQLESLASNVT